MKIGVIGVKDGWSSNELADELAKRTGERNLFDMSEAVFDSTAGTVYCGGIDLSEFDAFAVKKIGSVYSPSLLDRLEMLVFLEKKGIRMFSGAGKIISMLDRMSCTVRMASAGVNIPPTIVTESFTEAVKAVSVFKKAVLKPLYTTKAKGMAVIEAGPGAAAGLEKYKAAGNTFFYIQKFIEIKGRDFGVVFLGGRHLTTYARVGKEGAWNTTTDSGGKYTAYDPGEHIIEQARLAQEPFGLDFTCVDMAETQEGVFVFEVSAFGGFRGIKEARNINAAEKYAEYIYTEVNR